MGQDIMSVEFGGWSVEFYILPNPLSLSSPLKSSYNSTLHTPNFTLDLQED
jgi:hypothetical protein